MHDDSIYNEPSSLLTKTSGPVATRKITKPWGHERLLVLTDQYCMKELTVDAGQRLSVQYHKHKMETLYCLKGEGKLYLDDERFDLHEGVCIHIKPHAVHSIEAGTQTVIMEVSTPQIDDVVRVEDKYGRK